MVAGGMAMRGVHSSTSGRCGRGRGRGRLKVTGELGGSEGCGGESFGADGPDGGDPGEMGAAGPLMGEVEPEAGADLWVGFDLRAGFERDERGVADEERGVGVGEHGDGVGGRGEELGVGGDEVAEEDLRVGDRAARGGVGGDGADGGEDFSTKAGSAALFSHISSRCGAPTVCG